MAYWPDVYTGPMRVFLLGLGLVAGATLRADRVARKPAATPMSCVCKKYLRAVEGQLMAVAEIIYHSEDGLRQNRCDDKLPESHRDPGIRKGHFDCRLVELEGASSGDNLRWTFPPERPPPSPSPKPGRRG